MGPLPGEELPAALTGAWTLLLGLVVGSFLNVVIHRVPRGESVVTPRSRCPACGRGIAWWQNVPLLSWVLLRGRCAGCGARISWRYPAVELLTGLLFLATHDVVGFTAALGPVLAFVATIIALAFIDAEHLLLPDVLTLPLAVVGLAFSWASPLTTPEDALLGVLLSWAVLEGMNLAYKIVRGRDGFGGGDTKMMILVAAFLGWQMALMTLVLGSLLGVFVGIPVAWWRGRKAPRDAAPEPPAPVPAPGDAEPGLAPVAEPADRGSELKSLLPQNLDEALPLLILPTCALAWKLEGADPRRTLAGLLAGIALAVAIHVALRRGGRQSPLGRALPWIGCLAGLPPTLPAAGGAALAVALVLLVFRPALAAQSDRTPEPEAAEAPTSAEPLGLQSELPFGVFLAAGALVALLAGPELLDAYANAFLLAGP